MDLDTAAPATSRRGLISALGAAGIASAAALSIARPASAAPFAPTDEDKVFLRQAMELELTAQALYQVAIESGVSDVALELAVVFAENHVTYADKIAGGAGFSANTRNEEVFELLEPSFATSNAEQFAAVARNLENTAAATHTALLPGYVSVDARTLTASILVVEARMATVLTEFGGLDSNLDEVFEPDAQPLDLTAGAES